MKLRYIALLTICAATTVYAKPKNQNVDAMYVIDGDTISIGSEIIRLKGIDAPELFSPGCMLEYQHAVAAKNFLVNLLQGKSWITVVRTPIKDKYRRTIGDVLVGGKSVAETMVTNGYAVPYYTNKNNRVRQDWCEYLRNHA